MLNEERVKLMVKLAAYEEKEGKEDIKVSTYFKKDYVSFNRWVTMIWTTIGYAMIVGLIGIAYMDQILEELTLRKGVVYAGAIVAGYLGLLVIFWVVAGIFYGRKHAESRQRVKKYSHNLLVLNKLYEKENM